MPILVAGQTFTVNSTADAVDNLPEDGICETSVSDECTLRAAIHQANELPGLDTIVIPAGKYVLTLGAAGEDENLGGDLDIKDSVVITGAGPDVSIVDGNQLDRVFHIAGSNTERVVFEKLSVINGNAHDGNGGGIGADHALLNFSAIPSIILTDMAVLNNSAKYGGGISVFSKRELIINNSNISGNSASFVGGGVQAEEFVAISNSTISDNTADLFAGGIDSDNQLELINSVISNNTVNRFGGGVSANGVVFLIGGEISKNIAGVPDPTTGDTSGSGGGLHISSSSSSENYIYLANASISDNKTFHSGGGIDTSSSSRFSMIKLINMDILRNVAGSLGGGLLIDRDFLINRSRIVDNVSGVSGGGIYSYIDVAELTSTISHSVIANNSVNNTGNSASSLSFASGGGLDFNKGKLALNAVTISNNSVATLGGISSGGGLSASLNISDSLSIKYTTFANNIAADRGENLELVVNNTTTSIGASIFQGTVADLNCSIIALNGYQSNGYNISSDNSCLLNAQTDSVSQNILLSTLADNGGQTLTHALQTGSDAIDHVESGCQAADSPLYSEVDQRLYMRADGKCDSGAFEVNPSGAISNQGEIHFSATAYSVDETAGFAVLTLERIGGTTGVVAADIITRPHTAQVATSSSGDSDYEPLIENLQWLNGDSQPKQIQIAIIDDKNHEGDEQFFVNLLPTQGAISSALLESARVTINDDEKIYPPMMSISSATTTINETQKAFFFTIERYIFQAEAPVSVNYSINGSATNELDYQLVHGVVDLQRGELKKSFVVFITDDNIHEPDETIELSLDYSPDYDFVTDKDAITVTIVDNDSAIPQHGELNFVKANHTLYETGTVSSLEVTRTSGSDGEVSVEYRLLSGSAQYNSDFAIGGNYDQVQQTGSLIFQAGVTSQTIPLTVTNDGEPDSGETFSLQLQNPQGGAIIGSTDSATVTLNDPVGKGSFQFEQSQLLADEGNKRTVNVIIKRVPVAQGPVLLDLQFSGSAKMGSDYKTVNNTLNITDKMQNIAFTMEIIDDLEIEEPENIVITLSTTDPQASIGTNNQLTITLTDNDIRVVEGGGGGGDGGGGHIAYLLLLLVISLRVRLVPKNESLLVNIYNGNRVQ